MSKRSLWLLAGLVLVASLIVGPGAGVASPAKSNTGTSFIHDQEPPEPAGPVGRQQPVRDGARAEQHLVRVPDPRRVGCVRAAPLHGKAHDREEEPAHDQVHVRRKPSGATASPSAEDFWQTWQTYINPKFNPISRTGYEDIKSVTRGNGKNVTVVFRSSTRTGRASSRAASGLPTSSRART
jgi:hypothetical protein